MSGVNARELIHEIKIRPGIYDRDALVPPRREHKHKLWLEVAERLTPSEDWESFTDVEKDARVDEIAGKWKHIRNNFHRDVKLEEAGEAHKKRKYIYFKEMEFMRPFIGLRLPRINKRSNSMESLDDTDDCGDNDTDIDMDSFLKSSDSVEEDKSTISNLINAEARKSKRIIKPTAKVLQSKTTTNCPIVDRTQKDPLPKNLNVLKRTGSSVNPSFKIRDGDISFCLSLVPTLRKLGDGRKLRAKIEILKTLHRYIDHIERRNLVGAANVSNNHNMSSIKQNADVDDDMPEDHLEEYEEGVIIKNEEHDDPLNGNNGNNKAWWT